MLVYSLQIFGSPSVIYCNLLTVFRLTSAIWCQGLFFLHFGNASRFWGKAFKDEGNNWGSYLLPPLLHYHIY